jgi:hypothetical protein
MSRCYPYARVPVLRWAAAAVVLTACTELESQDQVKDLRVLAIRTEPPEVLYSFLHFVAEGQRGPLPLGPHGVRVEVLAADPQGRQVEVTARLCPEETEDPACPGYRIRDSATAEEIRAVTPLLVPRTATRTGDMQVGGQLDLPVTPFTLLPAAVDYMIPHDVNGRVGLTALFTTGLPAAIVRARTQGGGQTEVAYHRFQVNADLSGAAAVPGVGEQVDLVLRQVLGFGRCTPAQEAAAEERARRDWEELNRPDDERGGRVFGPGGGAQEEPTVQCVRRRVVNRNPAITRVLYALGGGFNQGFVDRAGDGDVTGAGRFQDVTGRVVVEPGQTVALRPAVADGDRERYQYFQLDTVTGRTVAKERFEDMAFSWFTTVGRVEHTTGQSWGRWSESAWTPSIDAPDGPAVVWVVARDQRGGVDWRRLDFEVRTPPSETGPGGGGGLPLPFGGGRRGR